MRGRPLPLRLGPRPLRLALGIAFVSLMTHVGACVLLVDVDGLSGGALDGGNADTKRDTNADTNADTKRPADAPFCSRDGGTLCEDFDNPRSTMLPDHRIDDGGTAAIVTDPRVSPPAALRMTLTKPPDATCHSVLHSTSSGGVPAAQGFLVEFKVHLTELHGVTAAGTSVRLAAAIGADVCDHFVELGPTGAAAVIESNTDPPQRIPLKVRPLPGEWAHIVFDVNGNPGGRTLSAFIDGEKAATDVPLKGRACQNATRFVGLAVGLRCVTAQAGGNVDVTFDDVRVVARAQ